MLCDDAVQSTVVSPDRKSVAEIVQSDCGATEHQSVVRLRRNRMFLSGTDDAMVIMGGHDLKVGWHGNRDLVVTSPTCDPEVVVSKKWRDIAVKCEQSTPVLTIAR